MSSSSTTLHTFIFETSPSVFAVEILGSWDNFRKSYALKQDRQTYPGHWRGCHRFENITCDGDTMDPSAGRDGGLKMGGKYWYFYRLDGDVEMHDTAVPSTSSCPLLPGQTVNILDVPVQEKPPKSEGLNDSSSSISSSMVFTLDPRDKYLPQGVRRAATTSSIHSRKASLATGLAKVTTDCPESPGSSGVPPPSLGKERSLLSVFGRMRKIKSADSSSKSISLWPRKLFSRTGKSRSHERYEFVPEVPKPPKCIAGISRPTATSRNFSMPTQQPPTPNPKGTSPPKKSMPAVDVPSAAINLLHDPSQSVPNTPIPQDEENRRSSPLTDSGGFSAPNVRPLDQLRASRPYLSRTSTKALSQLSANEPTLPRKSHAYEQRQPIDSRNPPFSLQPERSNFDLMDEASKDHPALEYIYSDSYDSVESTTFSYTNSDNFSPCYASTTTNSAPMSPVHLSQPETPLMSDFDEEISPWSYRSRDCSDDTESVFEETDQIHMKPPSRAPPSPPVSQQRPAFSSLGNFQGYSLPDTDQVSVHTIRKIPSTFKPADSQPGSKQDLVGCWDDGSGHRMSSLEEAFKDLGYLGGLIS